MKKTSQPRARKSPASVLSTQSMKSPSPSATKSTAASHTVGEMLNSHQDDSDAAETDRDPGVRYITESLVQKLTKQENLGFVTSLNLCLSKQGGKKFKFIENLEKCVRLEVLNLSFNLIEKVEKLDKQVRLRELNLSFNKISKFEGLEHVQQLQKLNLAGNEIEHIPAWVGKKVRSLSRLNLKQNKIFSLQDVSRLKPLKDLTSLVLADNPIADLPHYRLYTIFHLRSLDTLDDQPVTDQERQKAHDRFNLEEVEKLERGLEKKAQEVDTLQNKKADLEDELYSQEEVNRSLKEQAAQQKKSYKELQRETDTKNEILKQKTLELTRACQKQYELEQELAFYKIDAKFEPMGYIPPESLEVENVPGESPYIGKARYKRNLYVREGFIADRAQPLQVGKVEMDGDGQIRNEQIRARIHTTLDIDVDAKERNIQAAQARLTELHQQIMNAEEHILKATEELKELEDAVAQKKISEAEKEKFRQQLSSKIKLLKDLRHEAQEMEKQMDWQRGEIRKKQKEIEDLQRKLDSLSPLDPQHSHVKAQKAGKEQQLDIMTRQYQKLEGRLDEMLSRIAKETEEIKDLEQQLTDGQIAANEVLKRDLEGIIAGLQEYLESVKGQAKQAHEECAELQLERTDLLQRLSELEEENKHLEIVALDAENMKKEISELERGLRDQQELNESLRQAQGDLSEYEAELEAHLKVRDAEANQLKHELDRLKKLSHMENSALQAELVKDKQALENALTKAQLLEEKEKENKKLLSQMKQLQEDNILLKEQLEDLQAQLDDALDNLVHPDEITARVADLKQKLQTGVGEVRCSDATDVLGQNLLALQNQINQILARSQEEKKAALERQKRLQEEIAVLHEKAKDAPGDYKRACNKAAEARIQAERRQQDAKACQLENEIRQLKGKLKDMEEIQSLADQQLVEAEEEHEKLMMDLQDSEEKRKMEDSQAQKQLSGLERELKELKRAVATSDKKAASELSNAKDQLQSLHGTVLKLNQERLEDVRESENVSSRAAQASRDLAKAAAEIELLQSLLKETEKQLQEEMQHADSGIASSSLKQAEMEKLNQTLNRQKAEIERLKHVLDHTRIDNAEEIEDLLDEIDNIRHALGYQNDYITSMADPFRRKGYWYYVRSSSNGSGLDSPSTRDSGLGVHYPITSSPARGKCNYCKRPRKENHAHPGHWVYSPIRAGLHRSRRDRDDRVDCADSESSVPAACHFVPPPGSIIYTVLPDGTPTPQGTVIYGPPPPCNSHPVTPGTVIYGPPPTGAQIVCGPPPPHFTIPLIPAGVLHCNVPTHHNMENEITRLEDIVDHLKSRQNKEKKTKQKLLGEIDHLERQKVSLLEEAEETHTQRRKSKRKDFIDGHIDSLVTELKLEKSLHHHDHIVDEIECVEKTLLKRRAELREADRLLAEAETDLSSTRAKTSDMIEKYNTSKKHLRQTESDSEELERRAEETAKHLIKANQQLRMLQANAHDLEQHRLEQENILQEINSVVSAKDSEFQTLNGKIESMTDSLQKLQADIQVTEGKEDCHLNTLKEAESILQEKMTSLEQINSQVLSQQQEIAKLDRLNGQKREELHLLRDHLDRTKADLKEVLREGELDVSVRRQEIKEVKSLLEDLSVQKGDLNAQLSDRKAQLAILKQQVEREEDTLQKVATQIHKHKSELKRVLEMVQLESNELQGLKVQHDQKIDELDRIQGAALEGKMELENLQRTGQRLQGKIDRQKPLYEKEQRELELIRSEALALQENVAALTRTKEQLEKVNQELEKKVAQASRDQAATEECSRTAASTLEKKEAEIRSVQRDLAKLNKHKQSLSQEAAEIQQSLEERKEELKLLKDELTDRTDQLKVVEQDLRGTTRLRDDLLRDQSALREEMAESGAQYQALREKENRKEQQLSQLQRAIEEKEEAVSKQEMHLSQIKQDARCQEEQMKESMAKLTDLKQTMEWELAGRKNALEVANTKVKILEEQALKLQQEEMSSLVLEEALNNAKHRLSLKEDELLERISRVSALEEEIEINRRDLSRLQDQMTADRKRDEKRIMMFKEALKGQRAQYEDTIKELKEANFCLQQRLTTVEQAAFDNHDQARRLQKEIKQLQAEYTVLQKQLKSQEDLDRRQQDVNEAVRVLKAQVKQEIQNSLVDFRCSNERDLLEDVDAALDKRESLRTQLQSLKEDFPFTANQDSQPLLNGESGISKSCVTDEHWRGEALREKLQQYEDRLKAQLHHLMSKQADTLSRGRQQTEGSLYNLRRQVDALDELVSNVSADSPLHSNNSSGAMASYHEELQTSLGQRPVPSFQIAGTPGISTRLQLNSSFTPAIRP